MTANLASVPAFTSIDLDSLDAVTGGLDWGQLGRATVGGAVTGAAGGAATGAVAGALSTAPVAGVGGLPGWAIGGIAGGAGGAVAGAANNLGQQWGWWK
ncbi:MAG: bacteriocin [Myxococcales bacterium]|nr:bacteriocin [Myxococcales bacterium]